MGAGGGLVVRVEELDVSTHSRPKAAGKRFVEEYLIDMFQHTAARRRLVLIPYPSQKHTSCFNTQPPEGGWPIHHTASCDD